MFLPLISPLLALFAAVWPVGAPQVAKTQAIAPAAGAAQAQEPEAAVASAPAAGGARVVAGTGAPAASVVAEVQHMVDAELQLLAPMFADRPLRPFFVFVHAERSSMPEALTGHLHTNSPGFALLGRHQVHLVWGEMRRTGSSFRGVVRHELVHELLDQFVAPHGNLMPRWFHEGLAQVLAGDTYLGASETDLIWRVGARRLLSFDSLRANFPTDEDAIRTAYGQSYSYVAWLARRYGLDTLLEIAKATDDLTSFERALVGQTRRSTLQLEDAWKDHLQNGSGASWRVMLEQSFSLLLIAALPVLVLALIRRLAAEQRAARHLASGHELSPEEFHDLPAIEVDASPAPAEDSGDQRPDPP